MAAAGAAARPSGKIMHIVGILFVAFLVFRVLFPRRGCRLATNWGVLSFFSLFIVVFFTFIALLENTNVP